MEKVSGASSITGAWLPSKMGLPAESLLLAQLALERDAFGHIKADLIHGLFETLAVFSLVDGICCGADQFDIVAFQVSILRSESAVLSAVCPPMVGSKAKTLPWGTLGRSRAMIFSTISGVMGSM